MRSSMTLAKYLTVKLIITVLTAKTCQCFQPPVLSTNSGQDSRDTPSLLRSSGFRPGCEVIGNIPT